jgi:hypothetical protein
VGGRGRGWGGTGLWEGEGERKGRHRLVGGRGGEEACANVRKENERERGGGGENESGREGLTRVSLTSIE